MLRSVLFVLLVFGCLILLRGCPDVQTEHVGVSYVDAYVAPGGMATLEIGTKKALAGQIENVNVVAPQLDIKEPVMLMPPAPGGWGQIVEHNDFKSTVHELLCGDPHHPTVRVPVAIPQTAKAAGWTQVDLHVRYVLATWAVPGAFDTNTAEETISVPLDIVSPGKEWQARARDLAAAGGILLGLAVLARGAFEWFGRKPGASFLFQTFAALAWIYPALLWAIWPTAGYLGWPTPWMRQVLGIVLLMGSWMVAGFAVKPCILRLCGKSPVAPPSPTRFN